MGHKMSTDRVRFKLTDNRCNTSATCAAAAKAFGLHACEAARMFEDEAWVICRPSQFARFIIYRSESIDNNAYRQFNATLFTPHEPTGRDVSKNPAQ